MTALPTSSWETGVDSSVSLQPPAFIVDVKDWNSQAPFSISHVFTHFDLELRLKAARCSKKENLPPDYFWDKPSHRRASLPSVFGKAFAVFSKS
jgi:adenine-specific DNA glycosylase